MNQIELTELARLVNQALYELEEFGKPQTENLWGQIYELLRKVSLTVSGTAKVEGRDDVMNRLFLVNAILSNVAAYFQVQDSQLSQVLNECACKVSEVRSEYKSKVYD